MDQQKRKKTNCAVIKNEYRGTKVAVSNKKISSDEVGPGEYQTVMSVLEAQVAQYLRHLPKPWKSFKLDVHEAANHEAIIQTPITRRHSSQMFWVHRGTDEKST